MNRRLALTIAALALFSARRVAAQATGPEVSIGYQGLPYKALPESKTGINLAEGVLLHVGAGAEAGYDSNVFYGSSSVPGAVIGSGILRFNGFGEITNASRGGGVPSISYDLRAGLTYRRYTSSNPNVERFNNAFMPSAGLSLGTSSGKWTLTLSDTFLRQEDPPYAGTIVGSNPITRDNNLAALQAGWSPGGGRIAATIRYTNAIDIFEQSSGFSYANSLTNNLMLDLSWKWLPKTAIFLQANQGWVTYLNPQPAGSTNQKVTSYPLRVYAGLRGLVTPKVTGLVALGYVNSFYTSGATTTGFWGSTYVDLQAIITPTMLNRITVGYHQDFVNSVISNFYYQYSVYASYVQQLAGRLALDVSARVSYLDYQGLLFVMNPNANRTDVTVLGGATLDYFVRSWIYAGVGYSLATDFSDFKLQGFDPATMTTTSTPVDYVKQQVFARLGVTY
jgi:hypothetical protein